MDIKVFFILPASFVRLARNDLMVSWAFLNSNSKTTIIETVNQHTTNKSEKSSTYLV